MKSLAAFSPYSAMKKIDVTSILHTPFFVVIIHVMFVGFAVGICFQLHRYQQERISYIQTKQEIDILQQTLAELKTSGSYLSSQTYRLKVAKRNYTNKKIEGERVLNTASIEPTQEKIDLNYIPEAIANPPRSSLILWNDCIKSVTHDACNQ